MTAIGICSAAHPHAGAYAEILAEGDELHLAGVADGDEDRGRRLAETVSCEFLAAGELLDRADGVIVASTNAGREPWVEAAAEAGVAVLAEKPLGTDAAAAARMTRRCREAGVSLSVAMPLRHSVPARQARDQLDALGGITALSGTNRGQFPGDWFADPAESGGGAVTDHTVHVVDLVHWLTGQRVAEVYAETATRFTDAPVEDVNVLSMALADGTPFSLDGSWSRPDEWEFWGDATLEIVGHEGVLSVDCFDQRFRITRDAEPAGVGSRFFGTDPNAVMLERFGETVAGREPAVPGSDAVDALAVVEAAYESAERGEAVTVEYERDG